MILIQNVVVDLNEIDRQISNKNNQIVGKASFPRNKNPYFSMQPEPYELDPQGEIYLVFDQKKFWHLSLDSNSTTHFLSHPKSLAVKFVTTSRAGPLNSQGLEELAKCEIKPKKHNDIETCLAYIKHHIDLKQQKGYIKGVRKGAEQNNGLENIKRPANFDYHPQSLDKKFRQNDPMMSSVSTKASESMSASTFSSLNQSFLSNSGGIFAVPRNFGDNDFDVVFQSPVASMRNYRPNHGHNENNAIILVDDDKNNPNSGKQRRVPRTFVGSFLARKDGDKEEFYKIQVLRKHLKIEEGITGEVKITPQYQTFKNKEEAVNQANHLMIKKIQEGFKMQDSRFQFDFENTEALVIKRALKRQKAVHNNNNSSQDVSEAEPIITQQQENLQVPNEEFQKKLEQIEREPALGYPMFNAFENLGEPIEWQDENPTGWYMYERLGGIRCVWNGFEFQSKLGNRYSPPEFFVKDFPQSPLDGMLYAGKRKIRACQDILKSKGASLNQWSKAQFYVYDAMRVEGTFEERFAKLKQEFVGKTSPFIKLCMYEKCESLDHFNKEFKRIEDGHGEGIVLKNPTSFYNRGTCRGYLEARAQYESEGTVVGVIKKEKASATDPIKSLEVEDIRGNRFAICRGITQDVKDNPPETGSRIIYRYSGEIAEGKPKAPILIRIMKPEEKISRKKEKSEG